MTHIRPYTLDDRAAVERMNAVYYIADHGFDASFAKAVTAAMDSIAPSIEAGTGMGWVIEHQGKVAGSIFLTPDEAATGRIRLFFLRPDLHGRGLGRNLLTQCLQTAPTLGFTTLCVSTFTIHASACGLYVRSGFQPNGQSNQHMFGRDLTQMDFVKPCAA